MNGSQKIIQGDLSKHPLIQVAAYIYRKALSGTLKIIDAKSNEFKIFFSDGMPVYIEGKNLGYPVGEIITEAGLITKEKLDLYIEEARKQKLILGQYLLKNNIINQRQLETAVNIQTKRRLIEILKISQGKYEFYPESNITSVTFENVIKTDLQAILPDAIRSTLSTEAIEKQLTNIKGFRFTVVNPDDCRKCFGWGTAELDALLLLDEKIWTIEKLEGIAKENKNALYVVLFALLLMNKLNFDVEKLISEEERKQEIERQNKIKMMTELMMKKMQHIENGTYFDILEVPLTATSDEIKESYALRLKEFHPDRVESLGVRELTSGFEKISIKIKEAFEVLVNSDLREKYISHIKGESKTKEGEEEIVRQVLTDEIAFQKAIVLSNKKNWAEVVNILEPIVKRGTDNGEYIALYAWAKISLTPKGEPITSYLKMLKEAVEKSPRSERANYYMALASQREGKTQDYRNYIKATVEINPYNIEAQRHLHIIKMKEEKEKKFLAPKITLSGIPDRLKDLFKKK